MSDVKIPEVEVFKILKEKNNLTQNKLVRELSDRMKGKMSYAKAFYFISSLFNRPYMIEQLRASTEPLIKKVNEPAGLTIKQVVVLNEKWEEESVEEVEDTFRNYVYPRTTIINS